MTVQGKWNFRIIGYLTLTVSLMAGLAFFVFLFAGRNTKESGRETVVVAVPYFEWVQDYETNYYTKWLEERTGYDIDFVYLEEGYEKESLNILLTSENSTVDAVFLPSAQTILSVQEYQTYIENGYLAAPGDYLVQDSHLLELSRRPVTEEDGAVDFTSLSGEDGKLYCFPSVNMARTGRNRQILWINIDWLTNLNLTMPQTTEEFKVVLEAFRKGDPNGNGLADELPLVSCEAGTSYRSYLYLLNAFIFYDEDNLAMYADNAVVASAAEREEFREAVSYCAQLYGEGLLAADCFDYTVKQLSELVNDPADMVGAFTSHSIADVVYINNPGILAHFVQLPPLRSGFLEKGNAVPAVVLPDIGGLIPANAAHKEAAAQVMDTMLSGEAALIALYGEENVDWRFSRDGELSTYGMRAGVTTIHYYKGERQNKNYAGAGPLMAAAEYTDGVTWNGDHSMTEYIDARAVKAYESYYPELSEADIRSLRDTLAGLEDSRKKEAADFLRMEVRRFVTGERDAGDDREWESFLAEYRKLMQGGGTGDRRAENF